MKQIILWLSLLAIFYSANAQQTEKEKAVPVLDHIAFYVKNLDASVFFYTKLFKIDSIAQPFKGARVKWFRINPGFQLHLVEGAGTKIQLPELSHICFSIQNLEAFIEVLKENHIVYSDSHGKTNTIQHRTDGVGQIFFQDPDGYWLEVNNATH